MATLVALRRPSAAALRDALDEVWAAGDAALPIASTLPPAAVDRLVARLRPGVVDLGDGTVRRDRTAPPIPPGTAVVVMTSGSTGERTGVVLGHDTLAAAVARHRARLGARDGQPWLGVLPLHHVAGLSVLLRGRSAGVEPDLHDRDDPAVVDAAPPSWISLVPTQLERLLSAGVDLARHHGVLLGGAAAPAALLEAAHAAGVAVTTSYGMTETCGGCVYDGLPLDDVEVRADGGRLWVRGPVLADGVRGGGGVHTALPTIDGWFRTADRGEVDRTGRVTVHGRADDVVVSGGENVPLAPVRRAVRRLAGMADADVVGLPDPRWGTAVTAVLVPDTGSVPPDLEEVRDALRAELPPASLPTRVVVLDAMPRDELGKLTPSAVTAAAARPGTGPPDG